MLQEAEKRDHRKIGKELKIFTFDDEIGAGLPLWLPNGTVIIDELEYPREISIIFLLLQSISILVGFLIYFVLPNCPKELLPHP